MAVSSGQDASHKGVYGRATEAPCPPSLRLYPIWRPESPESGAPTFPHGEEAEEEKTDHTIQDGRLHGAG